MSSSIRLSPNQQRVVDQRGGHVQVIACAGSGKTESISRRVAGLVADGAEPASIVAFTFTERAAAELKERIVRRVQERMGSDFLDRLGPMFVGTIHSYCFRILQDHGPRATATTTSSMITATPAYSAGSTGVWDSRSWASATGYRSATSSAPRT